MLSKRLFLCALASALLLLATLGSLHLTDRAIAQEAESDAAESDHSTDPIGLPAQLIRYPDVSRTHICFAYAGDIWLVEKTGGTAQRLTTAAGEELFPRFSADGQWIAFTGNYDGNSDVYVVSVNGGQPKRLTWHGDSDRVVNWSADGQVMFASIRTSPTGRVNQLFKVPMTGGQPTRYPMPYADFGDEHPDGDAIAYVPWSRDFRTWKRYRGGMAPDIWVYYPKRNEAFNMTQSDANESQPMWHKEGFYFLSDRGDDKRMNIWHFNYNGSVISQITASRDYDIHFPASGPDDMVFTRAGKLYRMDYEKHELHAVPVHVVDDGHQARAKAVKASSYVQHAGISPNGERLAFSARGQIFTHPTHHGVTRVLDGSSLKADRYAEYSADGKQIACFSDRDGEYDLWLIDPMNRAEAKKISNLGTGFRYRPQWSPDGKWICFIDSTMTIQAINVDTQEHRVIDKGLWMYQGSLDNFRVSWSADSQWIAYSRGLDNMNNALFLYNVESNQSTRITSGFYSDHSPCFDVEGDYLYFLSNREIKPEYSDLDNTWIYPNSTRVMCASLRADVPSPLAERNQGEARDAKQEQGEEETKAFAIELAGLESRAVILPMDAGNYRHIASVKNKLLVQRQPRTGSGDSDAKLIAWEFKERKEKELADKLSEYELAADGEYVMLRQGSNYSVIKAGQRNRGWNQSGDDDKDGDKEEWGGDDSGKLKYPAKVDISGVELQVQPRQEWRQIFSDAWRIQRDYFYDPDLHGVDWMAMRKRYGGLLNHCASRWDVEYLIGELIGELNASHTYRWGGDTQSAPSRNVGSLGADIELAFDEDAHARWQIKHILRAAAWDAEARSPLDQPGLDVNEGDYILAINGQELSTRAEFASHLQGMAGETIELTLASDPNADAEQHRHVLVKPISNDNRLRYLEWVESRRAYVEEKSGGKLGYVYVPNTGVHGQNELVRQYRAQFTKPGMVIDERFNGGGQLPDRFVEILARRSLNRWGVRDGKDWVAPFLFHDGPKAMLVNGRAGSGGDAFPYYFKQAGLGPLIGTRTWGGLIGITGCPRLVDGGTIFAPTFGIYSNEGEWIIEGHGVDPDIEVVDDPAAHVRGEDPQLDAAIEYLLEELEKNPPQSPKKPAYPDRSE